MKKEADGDILRVRPGYLQQAYSLTAWRGYLLVVFFVKKNFSHFITTNQKSVDLKIILEFVLMQLLDDNSWDK